MSVSIDKLTAALDELERLANAATEGPWKIETVPTSIGRCHKIGPFNACLYEDSRFGAGVSEYRSNAELLAASRTAIPALVAAMREMQGALGFIATDNYEDAEGMIRPTLSAINAREALAKAAAALGGVE